MAAPFSNLRSKLNRAVAAYLIAQSAGEINNVLPSNTKADKTFPVTVIHAGIGNVETPFTGNYRITLYIHVRGAASENVGTTQYDLARRSFDERVGKTYDALMQTEDDQTLRATAEAITTAGQALATHENPQIAQANADMADFTCQAWYENGFGDGKPDEEGSFWEEILIFSAVCCGSDVN